MEYWVFDVHLLYGIDESGDVELPTSCSDVLEGCSEDNPAMEGAFKAILHMSFAMKREDLPSSMPRCRRFRSNLGAEVLYDHLPGRRVGQDRLYTRWEDRVRHLLCRLDETQWSCPRLI